MTQIPPKKHWMKATALLMAGLFIWETAAWSAPAPLNEVLSPAGGGSREISFTQISIPAHIGSIQEIFQPSDLRSPASSFLIHIEDAHGEPEAQKNTQAILEHLKKEYGIQTFFLEGAWSKLEPSLLQFSNNAEENQKILSELTEKGIVGGPENFLYENSPRDSGHGTQATDVAGYGIESLELYKKNWEQFRAVMGAKAESDAFLSEMKAGLLTKASQVLNHELADYFRQWSFHEEIESDYSAHLRVLAGKVQAHLGLDLGDAREQYDWPMFVRFMKLKFLETQTADRRPDVRVEVQRLAEWLKEKKLSSYRWLLSGLGPSASGPEITVSGPREDFEEFYEKAAPLGFKFKDYPSLSKEWGKQILAQELDVQTLLKETETLENKLIKKLAQTAEEKKFVAKYREYLLLKKLLNLELSCDEWRKINPEVEGRRSEDAGSVVGTRGSGLGTGIEATTQKARDFYSTAEARDSVMVERTIDWIKKEKIEKAAIITGGFHSKGIGGLLKQKNISYLRVHPRITQIHGRENYLKLMMPANSASEVSRTTPGVTAVSYLRAVSPAEPDAPAAFRNALAAQAAVTSSPRFKMRGDLKKSGLGEILDVEAVASFFEQGYGIEFPLTETGGMIRIQNADASKFPGGRPGSFMATRAGDAISLGQVFPNLPASQGLGRIFIALSLMTYFGGEKPLTVRSHYSHNALRDSLIKLNRKGGFQFGARQVNGTYSDIAGTMPAIPQEVIRGLKKWNEHNLEKSRSEARTHVVINNDEEVVIRAPQKTLVAHDVFNPQAVPGWFRHLMQKNLQIREKIRFVIHEESGIFYSAHARPLLRKDGQGVEWLKLETYSREWPLTWVDWKATEEVTLASTQAHGNNYLLPFSNRSEAREMDMRGKHDRPADFLVRSFIASFGGDNSDAWKKALAEHGSIIALAAVVGVSNNPIRKYLSKHGLLEKMSHKRKNRHEILMQRIQSAYVIAEGDKTATGEKVGLSQATIFHHIQNNLTHAQIARMDQQAARRKKLRKWYVIEQGDVAAIAKRMKTSEAEITKLIQEWQIVTDTEIKKVFRWVRAYLAEDRNTHAAARRLKIPQGTLYSVLERHEVFKYLPTARTGSSAPRVKKDARSEMRLELSDDLPGAVKNMLNKFFKDQVIRDAHGMPIKTLTVKRVSGNSQPTLRVKDGQGWVLTWISSDEKKFKKFIQEEFKNQNLTLRETFAASKLPAPHQMASDLRKLEKLLKKREAFISEGEDRLPEDFRAGFDAALSELEREAALKDKPGQVLSDEMISITHAGALSVDFSLSKEFWDQIHPEDRKQILDAAAWVTAPRSDEIDGRLRIVALRHPLILSGDERLEAIEIKGAGWKDQSGVHLPDYSRAHVGQGYRLIKPVIDVWGREHLNLRAGIPLGGALFSAVKQEYEVLTQKRRQAATRYLALGYGHIADRDFRGLPVGVLIRAVPKKESQKIFQLMTRYRGQAKTELVFYYGKLLRLSHALGIFTDQPHTGNIITDLKAGWFEVTDHETAELTRNLTREQALIHIVNELSVGLSSIKRMSGNDPLSLEENMQSFLRGYFFERDSVPFSDLELIAFGKERSAPMERGYPRVIQAIDPLVSFLPSSRTRPEEPPEQVLSLSADEFMDFLESYKKSESGNNSRALKLILVAEQADAEIVSASTQDPAKLQAIVRGIPQARIFYAKGEQKAMRSLLGSDPLLSAMGGPMLEMMSQMLRLVEPDLNADFFYVLPTEHSKAQELALKATAYHAWLQGHTQRSEMRHEMVQEPELAIVQVMDWDIMRQGGMMTHVHQLNEEMVNMRPMRIHVLYRNEGSAEKSGEMRFQNGSSIVLHPITGFRSYPYGFRKGLAWMKEIRRQTREIMTEEGIDVIHSHQMNAKFDWALLGLQKTPLAVTNHMPYSFYAGWAYWLWPLKIIFRRAVNLFFPWLVPVLTAYGPNALPRERDSKVRFIEAGIDTDFFDPSRADRQTARKKFLGEGSDDFMIFYPARFIPRKGQEDLITAAKQLKAAGLRFRMVLMGPQDEDPLYAAQVKSKIKEEGLESLFNILPSADLPGVREGYAAADLVVFPTYFESPGLMSLEAQSMQRPVVSYLSEGVTHTLNPDSTVGVKKGDTVALAAAILALSRNPEKMRQMGIAGRSFVTQQFSKAVSAQNYFNLYHEMAGFRSEMRRAPDLAGSVIGVQPEILHTYQNVEAAREEVGFSNLLHEIADRVLVWGRLQQGRGNKITYRELANYFFVIMKSDVEYQGRLLTGSEKKKIAQILTGQYAGLSLLDQPFDHELRRRLLILVGRKLIENKKNKDLKAVIHRPELQQLDRRNLLKLSGMAGLSLFFGSLPTALSSRALFHLHGTEALLRHESTVLTRAKIIAGMNIADRRSSLHQAFVYLAHRMKVMENLSDWIRENPDYIGYFLNEETLEKAGRSDLLPPLEGDWIPERKFFTHLPQVDEMLQELADLIWNLPQPAIDFLARRYRDEFGVLESYVDLPKKENALTSHSGGLEKDIQVLRKELSEIETELYQRRGELASAWQHVVENHQYGFENHGQAMRDYPVLRLEEIAKRKREALAALEEMQFYLTIDEQEVSFDLIPKTRLQAGKFDLSGLKNEVQLGAFENWQSNRPFREETEGQTESTLNLRPLFDVDGTGEARSEMRQREAPQFKNLVGNGKGLGFLIFLRTWEFFYRNFKAWTTFRQKPWPIQIEGYENLWSDERFVLAGNHTGLAENLFFVTELYRLAGRMPFFIAQPEHVDAFTRKLIQMGGGLPIEKGKTVAKAKEFLNQNSGAILGVFPAGRPERVHERIKTAAISGKSDDEIARDFLHWSESSAAKIAVETGSAVVPFAIDSNVPRKWGVKELWRAFRLWQKNDPRQPPFYIRVRIGKPISPENKTAETLMSELKLAVVGELRAVVDQAKFDPTLWLDGYLRKFPEVLAAQAASKKWSDFKIIEFFHQKMLVQFNHEPGWAVRFVEVTGPQKNWFQNLQPDEKKLIRLYRTYLKLHRDDLTYFESLLQSSISRRQFIDLLNGVFVTATVSGLTRMPVVETSQQVPDFFYKGLGSLARRIASEKSSQIRFGHGLVFEWATEHLGLNEAFERWGKQNSRLMERLWNLIATEEKQIAGNAALINARAQDVLAQLFTNEDDERVRYIFENERFFRLRDQILESSEKVIGQLNHGIEIFKSFSPEARRGLMLNLSRVNGTKDAPRHTTESQRQRIQARKKQLHEKLKNKEARFYGLIDSVSRYVFEAANPDPIVRDRLEEAFSQYEAEVTKLKREIAWEMKDLSEQETSLEVAQKIMAQVQPYLHAYRERTLFAGRSEMRRTDAARILSWTKWIDETAQAVLVKGRVGKIKKESVTWGSLTRNFIERIKHDTTIPFSEKTDFLTFLKLLYANPSDLAESGMDPEADKLLRMVSQHLRLKEKAASAGDLPGMDRRHFGQLLTGFLFGPGLVSGQSVSETASEIVRGFFMQENAAALQTLLPGIELFSNSIHLDFFDMFYSWSNPVDAVRLRLAGAMNEKMAPLIRDRLILAAQNHPASARQAAKRITEWREQKKENISGLSKHVVTTWALKMGRFKNDTSDPDLAWIEGLLSLAREHLRGISNDVFADLSVAAQEGMDHLNVGTSESIARALKSKRDQLVEQLEKMKKFEHWYEFSLHGMTGQTAEFFIFESQWKRFEIEVIELNKIIFILEEIETHRAGLEREIETAPPLLPERGSKRPRAGYQIWNPHSFERHKDGARSEMRGKKMDRVMIGKAHVQEVVKQAGLERSDLSEYLPLFDLFRKASDHESGLIARVERILNNHFSPLQLKQDGDFLDVGASDGAITQVLMPSFKRGVAVEIDKHASQRLKSKEIPGLDVITVPIQEYVPDHKFDVILVSHSLYYIEEKDRMNQIKRMASWLKPGGKLILLYTVHGSSQKDLSRMKKALSIPSQPIDGRAIKDRLISEGFEASLEILESTVTADLDEMLRIVPFVLKKAALQSATADPQVREYIERNLWDEVQHNYRLNIPQELLIISNGSGDHNKNASDGAQSDRRSEMRDKEHVALYSFGSREAIMSDPNVLLRYSAYKYGSQEQLDYFLEMLQAEILKKFGDQIKSNPGQWVLATTGYSLSKPSIVPLARKLSAKLGIEYVSVRAVRKNRISSKPLIYAELKTQAERDAVQEMYEYSVESDQSYEGKNVIFVDDFFASGSALRKINTVLANKYQMRIAGNFVIISIASIETKDPAIEEEINSFLIRSRPLEETAKLLNRRDTTITRYVVAALFQMEIAKFRALVALLDGFYLSKLFIAVIQNYRDAVDVEKIKILNDRIRASSLNRETLVRHLKQQNGGLVLLGGPSGAGKTAVADSLKELLGSPILPVDFYPSDEGATKYGTKSHERFISHNNELVWAHVSQLLQGQGVTVTSPYYYAHPFTQIINPPFNQPLIVDGLHAVNPSFIEGLPKSAPITKVFVDAPKQIRFMRRLLTSGGDTDYAATLLIWRNVLEAEEEAIDLSRNNADFILVEPVDAAEIQRLAKATSAIRASLRDHLADLDERHDSQIVLKGILDDVESFIEERGMDHNLNKILKDEADFIRSKRKGLRVGIVGAAKPSKEYTVADGERLGRALADYLRPLNAVAFTGGDSGVGADFYRGYFSSETSKDRFFALLPTGFGPNEEYQRVSSDNLGIERLGTSFTIRNMRTALVGDVFIAMNGNKGTTQEVIEVLKSGKPVVALNYGGVGSILYEAKINGKIPQDLQDKGLDENALKFIILGDINSISQALDQARELVFDPAQINNPSSRLLSDIEKLANQTVADMERDANPEDQRLIREIYNRIQKALQILKQRAEKGFFILGDFEDLLHGQESSTEALRDAPPVIVELPGTFDPPHFNHVEVVLSALVGVSDTTEPRTYYGVFSPIGDRFTGEGDSGVPWKPNKSPFEDRFQMTKLISEIFKPLLSTINASRDSTQYKGGIDILASVLAPDLKALTNFYTITGADNLEHLETHIAKDLNDARPGIRMKFVLLNDFRHPDVVARLKSTYSDNVLVVDDYSKGARSTEIRTKQRIGVLPISIQKYIHKKLLYSKPRTDSRFAGGEGHRSEMRVYAWPSREAIERQFFEANPVFSLLFRGAEPVSSEFSTQLKLKFLIRQRYHGAQVKNGLLASEWTAEIKVQRDTGQPYISFENFPETWFVVEGLYHELRQFLSDFLAGRGFETLSVREHPRVASKLIKQKSLKTPEEIVNELDRLRKSWRIPFYLFAAEKKSYVPLLRAVLEKHFGGRQGGILFRTGPSGVGKSVDSGHIGEMLKSGIDGSPRRVPFDGDFFLTAESVRTKTEAAADLRKRGVKNEWEFWHESEIVKVLTAIRSYFDAHEKKDFFTIVIHNAWHRNSKTQEEVEALPDHPDMEITLPGDSKEIPDERGQRHYLSRVIRVSRDSVLDVDSKYAGRYEIQYREKNKGKALADLILRYEDDWRTILAKYISRKKLFDIVAHEYAVQRVIEEHPHVSRDQILDSLESSDESSVRFKEDFARLSDLFKKNLDEPAFINGLWLVKERGLTAKEKKSIVEALNRYLMHFLVSYEHYREKILEENVQADWVIDLRHTLDKRLLSAINALLEFREMDEKTPVILDSRISLARLRHAMQLIHATQSSLKKESYKWYSQFLKFLMEKKNLEGSPAIDDTVALEMASFMGASVFQGLAQKAEGEKTNHLGIGQNWFRYYLAGLNAVPSAEIVDRLARGSNLQWTFSILAVQRMAVFLEKQIAGYGEKDEMIQPRTLGTLYREFWSELIRHSSEEVIVPAGEHRYAYSTKLIDWNDPLDRIDPTDSDNRKIIIQQRKLGIKPYIRILGVKIKWRRIVAQAAQLENLANIFAGLFSTKERYFVWVHEELKPIEQQVVINKKDFEPYFYRFVEMMMSVDDAVPLSTAQRSEAREIKVSPEAAAAYRAVDFYKSLFEIQELNQQYSETLGEDGRKILDEKYEALSEQLDSRLGEIRGRDNLEKTQLGLIDQMRVEELSPFARMQAAAFKEKIEEMEKIRRDDRDGFTALFYEALLIQKKKLKAEMLLLKNRLQDPFHHRTKYPLIAYSIIRGYSQIAQLHRWHYVLTHEPERGPRFRTLSAAGNLIYTLDYSGQPAFKIVTQDGKTQVYQMVWKYHTVQDGSRILMPGLIPLEHDQMDKAYRGRLHTIESQERDFAQLVYHELALTDLSDEIAATRRRGELDQNEAARWLAVIQDAAEGPDGKGGLKKKQAKLLDKGQPVPMPKESLKMAEDAMKRLANSQNLTHLETAQIGVSHALTWVRLRLPDIRKKKKGVVRKRDYLFHQIRTRDIQQALNDLSGVLAKSPEPVLEEVTAIREKFEELDQTYFRFVVDHNVYFYAQKNIKLLIASLRGLEAVLRRPHSPQALQAQVAGIQTRSARELNQNLRQWHQPARSESRAFIPTLKEGPHFF